MVSESAAGNENIGAASIVRLNPYSAGGVACFKEVYVAGLPGSLSSVVGSLGSVTKAVNSQSPAQNPGTPQVRIDTQRVSFLDVTRIIESIKRALENEGDETMQQLYQLMLSLMESRKAGTSPVQLLQELAQAIQPAPPAFGAPGMQAPMMPQPPPSGGGMMGAQPPAAPQPGPTSGP